MPAQRRPLILDVQNVVIKYMDANQRIILRYHLKYFRSIESKVPLLIKKLELNLNSWKINDLEYHIFRYRRYPYLTVKLPIKVSTDPMLPRETLEGENAKIRLEEVIEFLEDFRNSRVPPDVQKLKDFKEEAKNLREVVMKFNERKVVSDQKFMDFFVFRIGENNFEEKVLEMNKKLRIRDFSDIRNYFIKKIFDGRGLVTVGTLALNDNSINRAFQGVPELKLRVKKLSLNFQTQQQTNLDFAILDVKKEDDPIDLNLVRERITVDSFPLESVKVSVDTYSDHELITTAKKLIIARGDVVPSSDEMTIFKNYHVHFGAPCQMNYKKILIYLEGPLGGERVKNGRVSFMTTQKENFADFFVNGEYEGKTEALGKLEKNEFPINVKFTNVYGFDDLETNMDITCLRLRHSYYVDIQVTSR